MLLLQRLFSSCLHPNFVRVPESSFELLENEPMLQTMFVGVDDELRMQLIECHLQQW